MSKLYFKNTLNEVIRVHSSIEDRVETRSLRMEALENLAPKSLVKVAFDTRRINQYTDYNPRRNLQYYHRSEQFISKDASEQLKTMFKLKTAVDSIRDDFVGDPDWFDSYCRILSAALDRTLRVEQQDMDFFKPQMDYLQELLFLRYRVKDEDIERLSEKELRNLILSKDEKLLYKQIYSNYNNGGMTKDSKNNSMMKDGGSGTVQHVQIVKEQDNLIEKLFGDIKASKDNKEVQRSVTITVSDKIVEEIKKEG